MLSRRSTSRALGSCTRRIIVDRETVHQARGRNAEAPCETCDRREARLPGSRLDPGDDRRVDTAGHAEIELRHALLVTHGAQVRGEALKIRW